MTLNISKQMCYYLRKVDVLLEKRRKILQKYTTDYKKELKKKLILLQKKPMNTTKNVKKYYEKMYNFSLA